MKVGKLKLLLAKDSLAELKREFNREDGEWSNFPSSKRLNKKKEQ